MRTSKKKRVIEEVFNICVNKNDFVFHNDLVKDVSRKIGVGNPFDATKLDTTSKLPTILLENDIAVIHLGGGYHKFIKGIEKLYHTFEPIDNLIEWNYKKSLLNLYNDSESNICSIANNQRILHHFLFGKDTEFNDVDILKRPKTYFPHRTKESLQYNIGDEIRVNCDKIQIEIDLTIEYQGHIGVFEVKNGIPKNFNKYQIYHPFLYYYMAKLKPEYGDKIKDIQCVYLVRHKLKDDITLKLWAYTFADPFDITSIKLIKSTAYKLIRSN